MVILHVKDSEGSMMTISEFDPNLGIFDIFFDFYVVNDSTRDFFYFSYIQSASLNKFMYFSKKIRAEKISTKNIESPLIYGILYT